MKEQALVHKPLPQNPDIWVSVPNYKEPILPVNHGGFGWYGLQAYDFEGDKLMCHWCGKFYKGLEPHIRKHHLNVQTYRNKYGLLSKTKLVSSKTSEMHRTNLQKRFQLHPEQINVGKEQLAKNRYKAYSIPRTQGISKEEYKNLTDSCNAQLIRRLTDASNVYGAEISYDQLVRFDSGLMSLLVARFGSFNKAKQIAKLVCNQRGHEPVYTRQLILEDMCSFYRKHKRWPIGKDYANRELICCLRVVTKNGGLKVLRQKAMKLKDEQDKHASIDINAIANKIEMEYAGKARK